MVKQPLLLGERVLLYRGDSCDQTRLPGGDQIGEMMRSVLVDSH